MRIGLVCSLAITLDAFFPEWVHLWQQGGDEVITYSSGNPTQTGADHREIAGLTRSPAPSSLRAIRELRRILLADALDVVVVNTATAGAATRLALRGAIPTVYFCHGFHWEDPQRLSSLPFRVSERFLARWADQIVVINRSDFEYARGARFPRVSHLTRGVGVDLSRWPHRPEPLEPGPPYVLLQIGSLDERKRPQDSLQVLSHIRKAGIDAELRYLGDGPLQPALEAAAADLGLEPKVHFEGTVPPLPHLQTASVVLHPAAWEGLPRAVIESVVVGTPVVTYRTKGAADVLGAVTAGEVGDTAAMASAAIDLLRAPPSGDQASHIRSHYSHRRAWQDFDALLDRYRRASAMP